MECRLTKDGVLEIQPDTDIEEYAINQWYKENSNYESLSCVEIKIMNCNEKTKD